MNTLILSKHKPTIEYIRDELDLDEQNSDVRHTVNPTEIGQIAEEYSQIVGSAPLWLIREFNRHGLDYLDFSFRRELHDNEELDRDEFDEYRPKIESFTVKQGNLESFNQMLNEVSDNPPSSLQACCELL